jgi:predicted Zn-dependent protease
LKYSREYETQADILGAQIMASAGYDPRDLANMFRTIEQQSGGSRNPEWLSSHPDPGNRYNNINREAQCFELREAASEIPANFSASKADFQDSHAPNQWKKLHAISKAEEMDKDKIRWRTADIQVASNCLLHAPECFLAAILYK